MQNHALRHRCPCSSPTCTVRTLFKPISHQGKGISTFSTFRQIWTCNDVISERRRIVFCGFNVAPTCVCMLLATSLIQICRFDDHLLLIAPFWAGCWFCSFYNYQLFSPTFNKPLQMTCPAPNKHIEFINKNNDCPCRCFLILVVLRRIFHARITFESMRANPRKRMLLVLGFMHMGAQMCVAADAMSFHIKSFRFMSKEISCQIKPNQNHTYVFIIPVTVVPHKAVAEVSKIGNL